MPKLSQHLSDKGHSEPRLSKTLIGLSLVIGVMIYANINQWPKAGDSSRQLGHSQPGLGLLKQLRSAI